ncbi:MULTISPECIES: hypothetical protein [Vibrio]|nr:MULTISPECIES: hypothetical protein [Vibrio]
MFNSLNKVIVIIFLLSSFLLKTTTVPYLVTLGMVFLCLLSFIRKGVRKEYLAFVFFYFFFHFFYILYGLLSGADYTHALVNFSGFLLIPVYLVYWSYYKLDLEKVTNIVLLICTPIVIFMYFTGRSQLGDADVVEDVSLLRRLFLSCSFFYVGFIFNYLFVKKTNENILRKLSFVFFFSGVAVLASFSKVVFLLLIVFFCFWFVANYKKTSLILFLILFVIGYLNLSEIFHFAEPFFAGYDVNSSGNKLRSEQLNYLLNDVSYFGSGLGVYIDGFSRRTQGYGIELTYFNLLHKFGVFSMFYFLYFFIPIILSFFRLFFYRIKKYDSTCFLVFPIVFSSALNPMLSAPVVLFFVSYWWYMFIEDNLE